MSNQKKLRSADWFGKSDKMGFVHRSWFRTQGYPDDYFQNKPVIGICNTWSELTPCNGHLRDFAEVVKRGVIEAGGFPLEFPVTSLGETVMRPTIAFQMRAMTFRPAMRSVTSSHSPPAPRTGSTGRFRGSCSRYCAC